MNNSSDKKIRQAVIISDTHIGCRLGLCPPVVPLQDGGTYHASKLQLKMWEMWQYFWNNTVPMWTGGKPYVLIHNGDLLDFTHHNSVSQISQNIADQAAMAVAIMRPVVAKAAIYYQIRGTEAHSGKSGQEEERIAQLLGARPDENGQHSRYELNLNIGARINCMHHIGVTGSTHFESSAPMKELTELFLEAGRWGNNPPDVVIRGHRHRNIEIRIPSENVSSISMVVAGWQLRTPFSYKIAGGRVAVPQIGGSYVSITKDGEVYARHKVWSIGKPKEEKA